MHNALVSFNESMHDNQNVRLSKTDKNRIYISPLDKQVEPQNINQMNGEIQTQWPTSSLLDMLKEADM